TAASARRRPIPRPRAEGRTYSRFISHVSPPRDRRPTQPAPRTSRSAPPCGGAYAPGSSASSRSKSWNSSENGSESAYSRKRERTSAKSDVSTATTGESSSLLWWCTPPRYRHEVGTDTCAVPLYRCRQRKRRNNGQGRGREHEMEHE